MNITHDRFLNILWMTFHMILTSFDHMEVAHEVFTTWVGSQQRIPIIK